MMKLITILCGIIVLVSLVWLTYSYRSISTKTPSLPAPKTVPNAPTNPTVSLSMPLDQAAQRITKKPFGIKISPQDSPVQPEKFSGYHTGTDFEIFPSETDSEVPVHAICDGTVILKRFITGYGGVLIQLCTYRGESITVLYGHLALSSIQAAIGDKLTSNQVIGNLGQGYSTETDGERKHLHLGIHRGTTIQLKGYVQQQSDLNQWLDFMKL